MHKSKSETFGVNERDSLLTAIKYLKMAEQYMESATTTSKRIAELIPAVTEIRLKCENVSNRMCKWEKDAPSDKQVKLVNMIAKIFHASVPSEFTKGEYSKFLKEYMPRYVSYKNWKAGKTNEETKK